MSLMSVMNSDPILAPEVAAARKNGAPLVALESTIISHGMPWPQNLETAVQVEACVREAGAVPATVAVLNGALHVGLREAELTSLAKRTDVRKLSRADMAVAMVRRQTGTTTVAATLIAAHLAGIKVFATGGIGGVHRGAEQSFDISADVQELAQTPITVVCAGPKAILDIPKTLEVLETLGVPMIAYGQNTLPLFWSREGGPELALRLDTAQEIAAAHRMRAALAIPGGQLIANPIPAEAAIPHSTLAPIIAQATAEAQAQAIMGKALTPHLLARIVELTGGASLTANMALIQNNARLGAEIACALAS